MPDTPSEAITITKRLHVSGLTTAISYHDLERRLATFGSVTALDGLGELDALGQPRKFAYVTLQTTKSQLSRCAQSLSCPTALIKSMFCFLSGMNVLSGSTWKGTKLRIGEAKPDFRERCVLAIRCANPVSKQCLLLLPCCVNAHV